MNKATVKFHRSERLKAVRVKAVILKVVRRGFDSLGRTLKARLRAMSPRDRGIFIDSLFYAVTGNNLTTIRLDIGSKDKPVKVSVIDQGRGQKKTVPPPPAIRGWVRRRGLTLSNTYRARRRLGPVIADRPKTARQLELKAKRRDRLRSQAKQRAAQRKRPLSAREREINQLAFIIARSIGKKGIPGRGVFGSVTRRNRDFIRRAITAMNNDIVRELNKAA